MQINTFITDSCTRRRRREERSQSWSSDLGPDSGVAFTGASRTLLLLRVEAVQGGGEAAAHLNLIT